VARDAVIGPTWSPSGLDLVGGRYPLRVESHEIASPDRVDVLSRVGEDRLVLTTCHLPHSAAQRIVASNAS
jgi:sortase (surface protein transpeptidase)